MPTIVDAIADLDAAVAAAAAALRSGKLVVLPTDTVYGVAADAFNPIGTAAVFAAKRRDRSAPLPVLVRSPKQLLGLVTTMPEEVNRLMAAYWPGPLTIVVRSEPHLAWDLGDSQGTVAVRMPFDDVTLAVISAVGPLAVTSANLSGNPAATTAQLARTQLGEAVAVYVDGGRRVDTTASTIVDMTRTEAMILRSGPLDDEEVLAVARGDIAAHAVAPWSPAAGDMAPEHQGSSVGDDAAAEADRLAASDDMGPPGDRDEAIAADTTTTGEPDVDAGDATASTRLPRSSRHVARDHRAER